MQGYTMKCLVTGAAGFIGSRLSETLCEEGYDVVGADDFSNYYSKKLKLRNLSRLQKDNRFEFVEADLASDNLSKLVHSVDYVFHLAAQPGVRASWGTSFSRYVRDNILATQRLLETVKQVKIKKLVYASSSSIYGDADRLPIPEETIPKPISPYGVTKLAAEHLCFSYLRNHGVPCVVLRYFTVYGPRQRPDMAFSSFIARMKSDKEILVYGDGNQKRDYTFVDDNINATISALHASPGSVYNVGTGRPASLSEVIATLERLLGKRASVRHSSVAPGDVKDTCADITKIKKEIGFSAKIPLDIGLGKQIEAQAIV